MARKKKQRPYEINRYRMGLHVHAGTVAIPQAHVVYEVCYSDGTSRVERGKSVFGMGTATKPRPGEETTIRPDLYTSIHAASLLNDQIERACLLADGMYEDKKKKKRRYKDEW